MSAQRSRCPAWGRGGMRPATAFVGLVLGFSFLCPPAGLACRAVDGPPRRMSGARGLAHRSADGGGVAIDPASAEPRGDEARRVEAALRAEIARLETEAGALRVRLREEGLVRQGRALREEIGDAQDSALAWSLNDVALLMGSEGRHREAVALHRRALAILEASVGRDHLATGTALHNLAEASVRAGDVLAATEFYREAAGVFERRLGSAHPRLAAVLNGWGSALRVREDPVGAEALYRRAISIYERTADRGREDLAVPLHNLGLLMASQLRHEEARLVLERALAIVERYADAAGMQRAVVLRSLAQFYATTGNRTRSLECERRAVVAAAGVLSR